MSVFDTLKERGYIAQLTNEDEIRNLLDNERITFYIGFDPTADSLHVGHFLQLMVMAHMQRAGHRPIALVGGGTAMVGDPTGKTDMRKMMTKEIIDHNAECFKKQISRFLDFDDGKALMVDNSKWLMDLNYIKFLREIGVHFSVNKMLTAECFKSRMERGLSFLEFNYMLMQSYDFLMLNEKYGCVLQLGGDDQWSNIIGGVELIRKVKSSPAYGMTFTLLTTSEGKKMGKTEAGAVWLDAGKTKPYDFYQYWRNVQDADVKKCLSLLTFLPMEEVERLSSLPGEKINEAKTVLAYEVTKIVHGEEEAKKAQNAALSLFGGNGRGESVPVTNMTKGEFELKSGIIGILTATGLAPSKAEARRLIQQGGIYINDKRIDGINYDTSEDLSDGTFIIRKGKKIYHKVSVK